MLKEWLGYGVAQHLRHARVPHRAKSPLASLCRKESGGRGRFYRFPSRL